MTDPEKAASRWRDSLGNRWWRIQNLYKIRDKNRNLVRLKLNRIQRYIVAQMRAQEKAGQPFRNLILKYRQGGVSTLMALLYLDDTIFHRNTITGILAHKKENLGYLFEIPRMAHQYMSSEFQPRLGDDSKTALSFPDINSKMFVSLSIRSTAVHNLHISEWAHCPDDEIQATLGSISPTANVTGETTANGTGNDFFEKYELAKMGKNDYQPIFIPWFLQEEYRIETRGMVVEPTPEERKMMEAALKDFGVTITPEQLLFRRQKERDLKRMRPQEFPENDEEAFLTSGNKFFDGRKVRVLRREAIQWAEENPPERGDNWIMYEKPTKGCVYVAGADTAEGLNGDYSVLAIINATKRRTAFRLRARMGVDAFARACAEWCTKYWKCVLGVERNNHGHAVLLALRELEKYPNVWYEDVPTRVIGLDKKERRYGWKTDNSTRPVMLDQLKFAVEGDSAEDEHNFEPEMLVLDEDLLGEAMTFEEVDGKFQAAEGKHDDTIFAYAIAWQMYQRCGKQLSQNSIADRIKVGGEREAGSGQG